jgi:hypothetical protein
MPHRILSLLLLLFPLSAEAETLVGKVVGVTDGDTSTLLVAERPIKIRLAEIDTPERKQPWGSRAKRALSNKVFGEHAHSIVCKSDRQVSTFALTGRGLRDMKPSILLLIPQSRQVTDAIGGLISLGDLVRLPDLG